MSMDIARPAADRNRPIERYARATVVVPGGSIEAGVERQRGEPVRLIRAELARLLGEEFRALTCHEIGDECAAPLIDALEARLDAIWPARAWFIELWQADECLTQVYAPWGMPKESR